MPRKFTVSGSQGQFGEGGFPPPRGIRDAGGLRGGLPPPPTPPPGIPPMPGVTTTPEPQAPISPVTPPLVSGRYAGAVRANPTLYVGNTTTGSNWPTGGDDQADDGKGWVQVGPIDRPTVLIPTQVTDGKILYYPITQPAKDSYAFAAFGSGVVFLWAPGVWWVKVDVDNTAVGFVQVPMDDPAAASLFASRPGAMDRNLTTTEGGSPGSRVVFSAAGAAADLLVDNPRRRAAVITTARASQPLDFGIILTKDGAGPAAANDCHFFLTEESVLELTGDTLWKGGVRGVILSSSTATAVDVYIAEFE